MNETRMTQEESEARAALELAQERLDEAQKAVTAALVPMAVLEASRHAEGLRLTPCISDARAALANARRAVETLLEYGVKPPQNVAAVGHQRIQYVSPSTSP